MTPLAQALRAKFSKPQDVLKALGLDEQLLQKGTDMSKPTKFAATALELTAHAVRPFLAKDAKIDLMPVFAGVTRANFNKGKIKMALDTALKGKLARDEGGAVSGMLDRIEHMASPDVGDESVSEAQHNAMGAAAGGNSNLGIPQSVGKEFMDKDKGKFDELPEFLKGQGLSEDAIKHVMDCFPRAAADAGTEEEQQRREEEGRVEDRRADDRHADDRRGDDRRTDDRRADDRRTDDRRGDDRRADDRRRGDDRRADDRGGRDEPAERKEMAERIAEKGGGKAEDKRVTKDEMDQAIKAAVATEKSRAAGLRGALDRVRPIVGDLAMAFDSAEDVYRHVLKMRQVPNYQTLPAAALETIVDMIPKAGARPSGMAQDAAASSKSFAEKYPMAARINIG